MNFRKLLAYLAFGTAAIMPLADAQSPTIVQGNYITNVFGNSNFVLNPNAQTNTANIAVLNATVLRSPTTPLVATSEANVTVTVANGTIAWSTRTFDAGMRNGNCEARFTYRGFQSTSIAQVRQGATVAGANVVAQLTLTPSATDPRVASINFPCGDLSQPTYFVITDTSTLAGTNEIGGIYVGLATNQANVAQAETVLIATRTTNQSIPNVTETTVVYATEELDVYGEYDSSTGVFTAKRAGRYFVAAQTLINAATGWAFSEVHDLKILKNNNSIASNRVEVEVTPTSAPYMWNQVNATIELAVGDSIKVTMYQNNGATLDVLAGNQYNRLQISRFPSSSELVVKPETQNVFGGIRTLAASGSFSTSSTTNTQITGLGNFTAVGSATSAGSMQFTMPTVPVGTYKLDFFVVSEAVPAAANQRTDCFYTISDGSDIYTAAYLSSLREGSPTDTPVQGGVFGSAVVRYNSVQTNKQFTVQVRRAGTGGTCASYGSGLFSAYFTITPLDQPSNSALYVQGPVLGAQTGAAIPAGYAGQVIYSTATLNPAANGFSSSVLTTISVTPGVWLVQTHCKGRNIAPTLMEAWVDDSGSTLDSNGENTSAAYNFSSNTSDIADAVSSTAYHRITSTKPLGAGCGRRFSGTTGIVDAYIKAIRIN